MFKSHAEEIKYVLWIDVSCLNKPEQKILIDWLIRFFYRYVDSLLGFLTTMFQLQALYNITCYENMIINSDY
jgi:hypothetical protein